jgi:hypothetical protein
MSMDPGEQPATGKSRRQANVPLDERRQLDVMSSMNQAIYGA